jgi:uncharacterized protein with GYD domain
VDPFILLGNFVGDAVKEISAERTVQANALIKGLGGKVKAAYALLGAYDLMLVVEFPGVKEAMKASVELNKLLGIAFTTAPAVTVEEFDALIAG